MLMLAFLSFAVLMIAIMIAPTGTAKTEPESVPAMRIAEAPA